jgi:hypothetical protein
MSNFHQDANRSFEMPDRSNALNFREKSRGDEQRSSKRGAALSAELTSLMN